jgi:hypothetical protein
MSPAPLPARTPPAPEHPAPQADTGAPTEDDHATTDPVRCTATPGRSLRCRFGRLTARTAAAVGAAHRAGVPF